MNEEKNGAGCAIAFALSIALSACQAATTSMSGTIDELRSTDAAFQQAIAARNLDRIAFFYADDAVLLPTAEPMVEGSSAIRQEWQHILEIPDFSNSAQLRGAQVSSAGDLGYTWGTYRSRMMGEDGRPVEEPGKWVTIWKHSPERGWRVVIDTYNTDVPPPDHK